jgi:hypothetical protein
VAIINPTLAKQYFRAEDPIGKKIGDADLTQGSIQEIVGVVEDIKSQALSNDLGEY